jgi:two-component system, NarL family, invasion response regulator UvrY
MLIKTLIVDDHAIVREGLKKILVESPDIRVVSEAADGIQAVSIVRSQPLDVVVLDISLPGRNGLEALKIIKDEYPKLPVLMLSIYPEDQYAIRSLKAGASGYLTKESAPNQLVIAIRKVASGGNYVSATLAEKIVCGLQSDIKNMHERLSDREFELLRMLASGLTATQIAGRLSLSIKTISTYRSRLLEKMKMQNNAELINYAIKNGLVH